MDFPEEVQFANQETLVLDRFVRLRIKLGRDYSEEILLAICPVGDQILLGTFDKGGRTFHAPQKVLFPSRRVSRGHLLQENGVFFSICVGK